MPATFDQCDKFCLLPPFVTDRVVWPLLRYRNEKTRTSAMGQAQRPAESGFGRSARANQRLVKTPANKRVLVCGGAGFLGSHLCERLLRIGDQVLCIDSFETGAVDNIRRLTSARNFRYIRHDITNPVVADVDEIYNLACPASPVQYQADPVRTLMTNVRGAHNMLQLARQLGARIFQASTSEVYGDPAAHPQREGYRGNVDPVGPRACYDEGKRCAETLFFDYRRRFAVDVKVARIFNTYGPRMQIDDGRVVSNFIVQALRNEPISIYGDGRQTRAFCYVDDLIDGIVRFMHAPDDIAGPLNLGNPCEISIAELAARIVDLTGSVSSIEHRPLPNDDPTRRCPDIGLARRKLGWQPVVPLEEGLKKTIDYFDGALRGNVLEHAANVVTLNPRTAVSKP